MSRDEFINQQSAEWQMLQTGCDEIWEATWYASLDRLDFGGADPEQQVHDMRETLRDVVKMAQSYLELADQLRGVVRADDV